jgi:hypothetical protein
MPGVSCQYGCIPICFLGDFYQLEPIEGKCMYTNPCGLYWHQALNCMVELTVKGTHRFSNCSDYKRIMTSLGEGILTDEDLDMVNGIVIDDINVKMHDSAKVRYSTFFNKLLFDRFSLICALDHRNCPQFGNGFFDRFSLICALDLQELSTVWKWLLWLI